MRIGLILNAGGPRQNVDLAQRAERAGFSTVLSVEFFNQHAFAVLGAVAQATRRVDIGTGIANSFTRSPLVHATAAMDLDDLSDGRITQVYSIANPDKLGRVDSEAAVVR